MIQEELLTDLANRSEMSDWFSREDVPKTTTPLLTRPNPKNMQNVAKIAELEQQIKRHAFKRTLGFGVMADNVSRARLQAERLSLEVILRPPSIPNLSLDHSHTKAAPLSADTTLFSPTDAQILDSLASRSTFSETISSRINSISAALGPTIDAFADGLHQIAHYREAADNVSGRVLRMCADKLEDREKEGRRHALGEAEDLSTPKDELGAVLRSISKLER